MLMDPRSNALSGWLGSTPVVMPVPIALGTSARLLGAGTPEEPDYTVYALDAPSTVAALPAPTEPDPDDARRALDEMESAARLSEYHDFDWWHARIAAVRAALAR